MALFTFDDLNEMKRDEAEFFGPDSSHTSDEFAPSTESLSKIRGYSRSLSIRSTLTLGTISFHLN